MDKIEAELKRMTDEVRERTAQTLALLERLEKILAQKGGR